jgi:hypothetical protein
LSEKALIKEEKEETQRTHTMAGMKEFQMQASIIYNSML